MKRCGWVAVLLWLGGGPAGPQGRVGLDWKWPASEAVRLETTSTTRLTLKYGGLAAPQVMEARTLDSYRVASRTADQLVLDRTVEAMKSKTQGFGGERVDEALRK